MNSLQAAEHVLLIIDSGVFMDLIDMYNVENAIVCAWFTNKCDVLF